MENISSALVIGAGTMGHGFAQVFAMNGIAVTIADRTPELLNKAKGWIEDNLRFMVELGEIAGSSAESALKLISYDTNMNECARRVDFITEAVNENLDLKKDVFRQLGSITASDVILASNTSSFDINELAEVTHYPDRVIGTHWFHPPQITPCVEVIPARATSDRTISRTLSFLDKLGKFPTLCKSAPGFVANRIQLAMAAEALSIVEEGLATPEEVDRIVKSSFGFRLSAFGPFQICDQAGLDTYYAIYQYLHDKLKRDQFTPPRILKKYLDQGKLGLKTECGFYEYTENSAEAIKRQRDKKLYARLRLFREEKE